MKIWQLPGFLVPLALLGGLLAATAASAAEKASDRPMRVYMGGSAFGGSRHGSEPGDPK